MCSSQHLSIRSSATDTLQDTVIFLYLYDYEDIIDYWDSETNGVWALTPHGLERGLRGERLLHSRGETPPQEHHQDSCVHGKGLSTKSHR